MKNRGHHYFCCSKLEEVKPQDGGLFWAAEIGVASGANANLMLRTFPSLRLYMVDPWFGDDNYRKSLPGRGLWAETVKTVNGLNQKLQETYKAAVRDTEFAADRRIIMRLPSIEAVKTIADESLSFCFIDGDHRYAAVLADMQAWYPKVRSGGIFAGHDFSMRRHIEVGRAVQEWSTQTGIAFQVQGKCWWLKKE